MTTSADEILILKQLEEIQSLRAQLADATRKLEAQPEVTGAVAEIVHTNSGTTADPNRKVRLLDYRLPVGTKLYPPSAIEAAVREKLEAIAKSIEEKISWSDAANHQDELINEVLQDCANIVRTQS